MAQDFLARRNDLAHAREALAEAHAAVLAAQADEARRRAERGSLARRLDPHDRTQAPRLTAAAGAVEQATAALREAETAYTAATGDARVAARAFGQLADPRSSAGQLTDGLPVLLFPLRLETRFGGGEPPTELWVRAYPDDCLVDSFEEQLSDAEIDAGERYWCGCWSAGGDEDRAARRLARARGRVRVGPCRLDRVAADGRSRPPPTGRHATRRATSSSPFRCARSSTAAEADAVRAYWIAIWRGAGDPAAGAAAEGGPRSGDDGGPRGRADRRRPRQ